MKAEPDAARALRLAKAFAFEIDADGQTIFADPEQRATALGLETGNAWPSHLSVEDAHRRDIAIAGVKAAGDGYELFYSVGESVHLKEIAEGVELPDGRISIQGLVMPFPVPRQDLATGLPNRRVLEESGTHLAEIGDRIGIPVYLLRIRLTNLHELTGGLDGALRNGLLREAGRRLQDALRAPDFIARLDGDDFVAVTLNSDPDTLMLRLRAAVTAQLYETPRGPLALEIDAVRAPLGSIASALDRTRLSLSGEAPPPREPDPAVPTVDEALNGDRLSLAFQPIVQASGHALHHFEVLLRLAADDGHIGSAFPFIVEAERQGTVHQIDRFVLDEAAHHLRNNPSLNLAVNVSAGTIGDDDYATAYIDAVQAIGDAARRLTLEMTETLSIDDPGKAERFSERVRALGCRFAIDDFASGHTSFRTLLGVDADCIKIDGSLVRGVALDDNKQAFIRMMVDLARTLSVETVAEMIEDRADADILARLGVDYLQGYYFAKPGPDPSWPGMTDR